MNLSQQDVESIIKNLKPNEPSNEPVTRAANNPMTWIYTLGFLFTAIISLSGVIYTSNLDNHGGKIEHNSSEITEIKEIVQKINTNQLIISSNIDRLRETQKANSNDIYEIRSTRVKPLDLELATTPLDKRILITEKELDKRGNRFYNVESEIRDNSARIKNIEVELSDRKNFMEDVEARLRKVEFNKYSDIEYEVKK